jgi:uncharacterized membrane protein YfcA
MPAAARIALPLGVGAVGVRDGFNGSGGGVLNVPFLSFVFTSTVLDMANPGFRIEA